MTHEKNRRRISRTNLEFSLASLERDNLSKQSVNELHQQHTFHHLSISNRLDSKTYQLFTKSPNLRADVDDAIYTTPNITETTKVHDIDELRKFLNSQQKNNTEVFQFWKERPFPQLCKSSISSSQSSLNRKHTSKPNASTSRSHMDDFEHLVTASVGLSVQQEPRSNICTNKQIYNLPSEDVIKNKWNEQRSSINEIKNELKDTATLADSHDSATKTLSNRFTTLKKEFCDISSKPHIVLPSYIDEKINDKYMDHPIEYLPLDSETNNCQSEAYYLDDGLRTMVNFRHGKETFQEAHRILHPCPSNPNRMNGSYRHDLNRKNSSINAMKSCTTLNIYSSSNNNTLFSPNVNLDKHFHHDKGPNLSDDPCNQGRFSPNQDHGYATLVSPSPTNHNTNTTQGIILYPPTSTVSPNCRNVIKEPLLWKKKSPFRTGPHFERLSDKVLLKIFNWLNSCDLCNVSRVCKRFNQLAWHPTLWREILLKGERINGDKALKMIFRKLFGQTCSDSCAEIERVMLSIGCKISDKGLLLLMRRCPLLTHLQLQNCVEISNQSLINVLVKCTNLQHLDVMGCTQITTIAANPDLKTAGRLLLQYLDVTDCIGIDDVGLKIIVKSFPHLIYLYLRRCIRITDAGFKFIPSFCITLKELSVSDCVNITDFGIYELAKLGPALRYLSVAKCDRVSDAGLKVIARRCYKLRYLNARGCEAVSDDSITVLARSCPRLRALDIGKCEVSDAGLRTLAESCPNLKKLSLKNCDMITDHGVQCIAYYCRGLQQLNIQDCQISVQGYRAVKKYCKRCIIEHTNPGFC